MVRSSVPLTLAAVCLATPGFGEGLNAKPLVFTQQNITDARGVVNVFMLFRQACLDQPVTAGLAQALVPEGFQVVSSGYHLGLADDPVPRDGASVVVTLTGREDSDWNEGEPYVWLSQPGGAAPWGGCSVNWHRRWDYEDAIEKIAKGMNSAIVPQISFYLEGVLRTPPHPDYLWGPPWSDATEWFSFCWDGRLCSFSVRHDFSPEDGLELVLRRTGVSD